VAEPKNPSIVLPGDVWAYFEKESYTSKELVITEFWLVLEGDQAILTRTGAFGNHPGTPSLYNDRPYGLKGIGLTSSKLHCTLEEPADRKYALVSRTRANSSETGYNTNTGKVTNKETLNDA